jgi:acyl carrier protein phosphodiesterase
LLPKYRKFSGIVVDLYYDHYLAVNWEDYSGRNLEGFVKESYGMLFKRYDLLPGRSKRILPFMVTQNWLVGYRNFKSLERVFQGMSRRSRFTSGMENAVSTLKENYEYFLQDFTEFFPEIIQHCVTIRENIHLIDKSKSESNL